MNFDQHNFYKKKKNFQFRINMIIKITIFGIDYFYIKHLKQNANIYHYVYKINLYESCRKLKTKILNSLNFLLFFWDF